MTSRPTGRARIVVTVTAEGAVAAETHGILGETCLDYIAVLEDVTGARTVSSQYTSDYTRTTADLETYQENHGVEHA